LQKSFCHRGHREKEFFSKLSVNSVAEKGLLMQDVYWGIPKGLDIQFLEKQVIDYYESPKSVSEVKAFCN